MSNIQNYLIIRQKKIKNYLVIRKKPKTHLDNYLNIRAGKLNKYLTIRPNTKKVEQNFKKFYSNLKSVLWEPDKENRLQLYYHMYKFYHKNHREKNNYIYSIRLSNQAQKVSEYFEKINEELNPLLTLVIFNPNIKNQNYIDTFDVFKKMEKIEQNFFNIRILYNNRIPDKNNFLITNPKPSTDKRFYLATQPDKLNNNRIKLLCNLSSEGVLEKGDALISDGSNIHNCLQKDNIITFINNVFINKQIKTCSLEGNFNEFCYQYKPDNSSSSNNSEYKIKYNFDVLKNNQLLKIMYSYFEQCKKEGNYIFDSIKFTAGLRKIQKKEKEKEIIFNINDIKFNEKSINYKTDLIVLNYKSNKITVKINYSIIRETKEDIAKLLKVFIGYLVNHNIYQKNNNKCSSFNMNFNKKLTNGFSYKIKCID